MPGKKLDDLIFHKPINFKFYLKSIPTDNNSIATSLFSAAWSNIVYVGQMSADKIQKAQVKGDHETVIKELLDDEANKIHFKNEIFVIEKK